MKKLQVYLLSCLFTSVCSGIFAQNPRSGSVELIQDERVEKLVEKQILLNEKFPGIEGYRIQILFESGNYSKRKATDSKEQFIGKYPDIQAYITFQEPYYKVRVGDFRTRIEAQGFLQQIALDFPNAYVVKEEQINVEVNKTTNYLKY
ncbi:MAG: SPOR domain-containing protein [Lentimicrobiaceae bacterium]|jgi:hypothetical protein|nr:SPOR domain-containing protein [Lentimicrobiaceae bacterium]